MASTVDAAILALTSLLTASSALAGVSVYDGQPMTAETVDWICVGYSPGESTAVDISYEWSELGGQRHEEHYDILCSLASSSGDEVMATRRARAVALRDAVAAVLIANPTLNGSVRIAHMSSAQLLQDQTEQGVTVGFLFRVNCQARISS